jgi:hypothetical protein
VTRFLAEQTMMWDDLIMTIWLVTEVTVNYMAARETIFSLVAPVQTTLIVGEKQMW